MHSPNDSRPDWASMLIHWPNDHSACNLRPPRTGDEAHKLASLVVHSNADDPRCRVAPELFHHEKADEKDIPKSGLSPFRYSSIAGGGLRLTAVGNDAVDALEASGHRLTRAMSKQAGVPLRETWLTGKVGLSVSPAMHQYAIRHLVLSRKPLRKIAVGSAMQSETPSPELNAWVEQRILDGILRQADLLGLAEPEDIMVKVESVGSYGGWNRGGRYYGAVAQNVVIATNLALQGPWSVGHLCLLGSGFVTRVREPLPTPGTAHT